MPAALLENLVVVNRDADAQQTIRGVIRRGLNLAVRQTQIRTLRCTNMESYWVLVYTSLLSYVTMLEGVH